MSAYRLNLIVLFLGFATFHASEARADYYRYVAKDHDKSGVFLNEDSVVKTGTTVAYWLVSVNGEYLSGGKARYAYYQMRQTMNCQTQTMRTTEMTVYGADGARLKSDSEGTKLSFIEPGTIEQSFYKLVCQVSGGAVGDKLESESPLALSRKFREAILDHNPTKPSN